MGNKEVLVSLVALGLLALLIRGLVLNGSNLNPTVKWEVRCAGPNGWVKHISNKTPPVRSKIRIFKIGDTYYTTCTFKQLQ